ncbi:unnamed protein product [Lota lota]
MPSFPFSQLVDVEETMCKQLLNLDLRDQNSALLPLSLAMKTPGYIGQPCNSAQFSSTSSPSSLSQHSEFSDAFLPSSHWCRKPDSPQPPEQPTSSQWGRSRFWAERSVSMVETSSSSSAGGPLGWPYLGAVRSTSLSTSPTLPSSSSASSLLSTASNSSGSSSSRYKTELCRSFAESSVCKYGNKCQFAHGLDELRDLNRHPKYKTEPCRTFHTIGFCPYGIRCHFVHNNEDDLEQPHPRSSSFSSSSSSTPCGLSQPISFRPGRPPLLRQSFSFAGFPSAPHPPLQQALPTLPPPLPPLSLGSFLRAPSAAAPPSCADITELLSHALLEMDSAFEASAAHHHPQQAPSAGPASSSDPRAHFLPSPDSGCSLNGFSPATSPSLRQSPGTTLESFVGPLGARSLSSTSLSEPEHDDCGGGGGGGGSSASSLSGSDGGDGNARRLAVFSQLSVPEDMAEHVL